MPGMVGVSFFMPSPEAFEAKILAHNKRHLSISFLNSVRPQHSPNLSHFSRTGDGIRFKIWI